ncbi:MAG: YXWGXW repeat-containing protein [Bryobacterales bacterium]|nr:YXWGXW repeat-containing protein [Bryobacterales bacterium]
MKKLIGTGIFALALTTTAGCAARGFARFGPPPPPPPPYAARAAHARAGRVWVPGYYQWTGRRYRWVEGRWVRPPRPGMVWVPGYREHRRGVYVWVEGHWR